MGAGTQTHLIFPRRAIPGVSWSPPLERAEVPQPNPEASREFAFKLAQRKAALEANPQSPPSPEAAMGPRDSPSSSTHTSPHASPRSEGSVSESADEPAPAQAAGPASIGSLIQKFERANQADAQVREAPSPRLTELDRQPVNTASHEAQDRTPSKPKWWQRLRRNSSKVASSQTRPEPGIPQKASDASAAASGSPQNAEIHAARKFQRTPSKAAAPAPIMTWYRACVSAPETPPAPFLSEDDAPPDSARIAAHRAPLPASNLGVASAADKPPSSKAQEEESSSAGDVDERPSQPSDAADLDPPASARIAAHRAPPAASTPGEAVPIAEPLSSSTQEDESSLDVEEPSSQAREAADAEPAAADITAHRAQRTEADVLEDLTGVRHLISKEEVKQGPAVLATGSPGQEALESRSNAGSGSLEPPAGSGETGRENMPQDTMDEQKAQPQGSRGCEDLPHVSEKHFDGDFAGALAAEAADLDVWLLPREPSAHSMPPVTGNAVLQTPNISPRTPEVTRESVTAPIERSSRLSRLNSAAPGKPAGGSSTQQHSAGAEGVGSSGGRAEADGGGENGIGPSRKAEEQLEAVRQLANQAARVQRRARRLLNGRDRQKGGDESAASQPADGSRKRASNTSPPPKRARRKDAQRVRTPSPEKVNQLLSDVGAVSEELHRRSSRQSAHAAFLDELQSGIEAVRTRLRTPAASSSSDADTPTHPARFTTEPPAAQPAPTPDPTAAVATATGPSNATQEGQGSVSMQQEEASASPQAEHRQLVLAIPGGTVADQKCDSGPDRVAEAAARAERAIAARESAAAAAAVEGTLSAAALQRSALDLATLSTTALTASMCLLVSVEQGVEVSFRACETICSTVLARVPFGSALLGTGNGDGPRAQPALAVRAMRGGIRIAYGAAGTVSGVSAGLLGAGAPRSLPWRH